jgi:hypothetical protein
MIPPFRRPKQFIGWGWHSRALRGKELIFDDAVEGIARFHMVDGYGCRRHGQPQDHGKEHEHKGKDKTLIIG